MAVLDPLKIVITNFPSNNPIIKSIPNMPSDLSKGCRNLLFDRVVYIEKSDFSEVFLTLYFLSIILIKKVISFLATKEGLSKTNSFSMCWSEA